MCMLLPSPGVEPDSERRWNVAGNFLDRMSHPGVIILQSGEGVRP